MSVFVLQGIPGLSHRQSGVLGGCGRHLSRITLVCSGAPVAYSNFSHYCIMVSM